MVTRKLKNPNSHLAQEHQIVKKGGELLGVFSSGDGSHVLRVFKTSEGDVTAFFCDGMPPVARWVADGGHKVLGEKSKSFQGKLETTKIYPRPNRERGY